MSAGAPRPEGWHTLTPRLFVGDVGEFVGFLRAAFGAVAESQGDRPTEVQLGDSVLMVARSGPREATSSAFYIYVDDADEAYKRAMAAGAVAMEEPLDTPYGDRRAMVSDSWGNTWQIARFGGGR